MSQEAKKDEFRKYLEKAGVLELLTKSLVQLYEVRPFNTHLLFFLDEEFKISSYGRLSNYLFTVMQKFA